MGGNIRHEPSLYIFLGTEGLVTPILGNNVCTITKANLLPWFYEYRYFMQRFNERIMVICCMLGDMLYVVCLVCLVVVCCMFGCMLYAVCLVICCMLKWCSKHTTYHHNPFIESLHEIPVLIKPAPLFFPGLFFYVYIGSPNPKTHQLKTLTPKTQSKTPTLKPQTTINEQK